MQGATLNVQYGDGSSTSGEVFTDVVSGASFSLLCLIIADYLEQSDR